MRGVTLDEDASRVERRKGSMPASRVRPRRVVGCKVVKPMSGGELNRDCAVQDRAFHAMIRLRILLRMRVPSRKAKPDRFMTGTGRAFEVVLDGSSAGSTWNRSC